MTASGLAALVTDRGNVVLAGRHDADEVVEVAARTLRPHRLSVRPGDRLRVALHALPLSTGSVNRLSFDAPVTVRPDDPDTESFLVILPVAGRAQYTYGRDIALAVPGAAVVLGPHRRSVYEFGAGFDQLTLRLSRSRVEAAAAALWPGVHAPELEFELSMRENGTGLVRLLESATELTALPASSGQERLVRKLEELIAETLLLSQANTVSRAAAADRMNAATRQVRDAMEFMRDRIGEPLRMAQVAAAAGVSLRSLQAGFAKVTGMTPTRWLRMQRLEHAYAMLRDADPRRVTVTRIAMESGMFHLGEFATHFKAEFGCSPSDVLAKR